ncbi:hypothetical protein [Flavobacterium rhizosphaerae]|uniref:DUF4468 domain-containing protein n=1 Tax=Flavobacterium rhizosphaerae TaxID=3163298 RepID=A0ABW8YU01_9FLAO
MKFLFCFISVLICGNLLAQPPRVELAPTGFAPIKVSIPATDTKKLVDLSAEWAKAYNKNVRGADVTDVTENSMKISAYKSNGFFYRERGETFYHKIRYTVELHFYSDHYGLQFTVNDIYADDDVLLDYNLHNYFTSDGKMKEGYTGLKSSIEDTVNDIIQSHYKFITNYR